MSEEKNSSINDKQNEFNAESFRKLLEERMNSNKSWSTNVFKREYISSKKEKIIIGNEGVQRIKLEEPEEEKSEEHIEEEKARSIDVEVEQIIEEARKNAEELIENAENQARDILEQAQNDSEQILSEAQTQAEEIFLSSKNEGYETGYSEGLNKGTIDGEDKFSETINYFRDITEQLQEERQNLICEIENDFSKMVISSVETIVSGELKINPDIVIRALYECSQEISEKGSVLVCLNGEDLKHLKNQKELVSEVLDNFENIRLIEDGTLSKGSVRIETRCGNIESIIEEKLKVLYEQLGDS